jgi:hypothetical protein
MRCCLVWTVAHVGADPLEAEAAQADRQAREQFTAASGGGGGGGGGGSQGGQGQGL